MNNEPSEAKNLIVFRPSAEYPVTKRERKGCRCNDVRAAYPSSPVPPVWIDEFTRALECKRCGAIIDPFDYLWALATEGVSLMRDLRNMREEKTALKAQIDMLNEELKEVRSVNRKAKRA